MSIGPAGFYSIIAATSPQASASGVPLAQSQGSDADRTAQEVAEQKRAAEARLKAESAEGVGQTDGEEHESNERDADGRRLWEKPVRASDDPEAEEPESPDTIAAPPPHASRDATGQSGSQLDLMG